MNFEALSLIHDLLKKHKSDSAAKVKGLNAELTAFQKGLPFSQAEDFPKYEELKLARAEFDTAVRALNAFVAVKWQGVY